MDRRRIAIVGGGIAGIAAAELLHRRHDVTLFEASDRLGGHARPARVEDPRLGPIDLDTAFLIFNDRSYPMFRKLLGRWGLAGIGRATEMSFLIEDPARDLAYTVSRGWLPRLGSARLLARLEFMRIFPQLARFRVRGARDLASGRAAGLTLREYARDRGFSAEFVDCFLAPLARAIWSLSGPAALEMPAATFLAFFAHHGYLGAFGSPGSSAFSATRWRFLEGSSRRYLDAFARGFGGALRFRAPVARLARGAGGGVELSLAPGAAPERFDHAVVATHADQALRLLAAPDARERAALGAWRYERTSAVLHTDASVLPASRRLWASWNVRVGGGVTYYLNRVQRLRSPVDYFVSLGNAAPAPLQSRVLERFPLEHPLLDERALRAQPELPRLNVPGAPIVFCGSYFGYGFHEDAVRSASQAAAALGGESLEE